MKICVFHNLTGGGSVRVLNSTISDLKNADHEIDLYSICPVGNESWLKSSEKAVTTFVSPPSGLVSRLLWIMFSLPSIHRRLAAELNSKGYDVALIHHDFLTKSPYLLRYLNFKRIYFIHEPPREYSESNILLENGIKSLIVNIIRLPIYFIDKRNVTFADKIIVNSKYSRAVILKYYKRDSELIYPRVDKDIFKPHKTKKDMILLVGGLNKIKGHDFVLKALLKLNLKLNVMIVGDGKSEYKKYLKSFENNNIKISIVTKHLSDKSFAKLYNRAIVHCIGAYREPFGLTSIEAQACGVPVVAVDEGGVSETILDGKSGYIVRRDISLFADKVRLVLKDPTSMSNNCIKNALRFSTLMTLKSI